MSWPFEATRIMVGAPSGFCGGSFFPVTLCVGGARRIVRQSAPAVRACRRIADAVNLQTENSTVAVTALPILVDFPTAASMLAMSESRLRHYLRLGMVTARYNGAKPLFLVTELVKFGESLPTKEWRLMPL